ncbi:MAG: DsbA family protein [Bryobacteraceae bacterium]|nr:DsbA family protein [Bryobacteraceae bacterium]
MKFFVLSLLLSVASNLVAADADKPMTQAQGDEMVKELRVIRQLLEAMRSRQLVETPETSAVPPPTAPTAPTAPDGKPALAKVTIDLARTIGDPKAPVTLVEFTDYQCGFCSMFHRDTFAKIKKEFVDTGMVRFASMDLPLDFHSDAFQAAKASHCAGEQNRYWEYRDLLSSRPQPFSMEVLLKLAEQVNLDKPAMRTCIASSKYDAKIKGDMREAEQANLSATPSFIVGKSTATGVEGEAVIGAYPFDYFKEALTRIKSLL